MDNIAEGFDDGSTAEFIRFLGYAQRSCGEVQSQLYRALDCKYIDNNQFDKVYALAAETRKQIKGFRKYLRSYKSKLTSKAKWGMIVQQAGRLRIPKSLNSQIPKFL